MCAGASSTLSSMRCGSTMHLVSLFIGGRCHGLFIAADRINCGLRLGSDVVGPLSGDNLVLASPRSYRPPPTSAGSGGGNGVVGVVVGGGAAGAAGVPGLWKSTTGSSRITLSPKLITRDLAVSR